ncbi:hypothetical protein SETIT_J026200v2 [Setaria italica]|uniref:DUF1618 domain-containing protein n=1 Tax=Setaria italica TaxID=4555 RepID=K3XUP7_SETIT|nr:hypothetical protein SETIT_J026200v2 [Setaria italica]
MVRRNQAPRLAGARPPFAVLFFGYLVFNHIYAQLPGFPGPSKERPLAMAVTHRHLALFRVGTMSPWRLQNLFIYSAKSSSLERLPCCTEDLELVLHDGSPSRHPCESGSRLQCVSSMGLLCQGEEEEEFAVAELKLYLDRRKRKIFADIFLFLKSVGKWRSSHVLILHSGNPDDVWHLYIWQTHRVILVDRWLCWIDCMQGILFYDVFAAASATISLFRFSVHKFPATHPNRCSWFHRGVSAFDAASTLKFVDVTRDDGKTGYKALKPGVGFTMTCHTLLLPSSLSSSSMVWNKDWTVTSDELWSTDDCLPRQVPMFPQVNIDRPHLVHLLISDFTYVMRKMWVVTIDMNTRTVESFYQYLNGQEDIGTEQEFLTDQKSVCPSSFLPSEFSKYLSSR